MVYSEKSLKRCLNIVMMIVFPSLLSSCFLESFLEWIDPDDKHSLQQANYNGNEIQMDGYYYYNYEDSSNSILFFILYRNGVVFGPWGIGGSDRDNIVFSKDYTRTSYASRDDWGLFEIEDSLIDIEFYLPVPYGGHPTYLMKGTILNDTTFHMTTGKRSDSSTIEQIDMVFHYCPTDIKPDSTNKYYK